MATTDSQPSANMITFGKHSGKTFEEVWSTDRSYGEWAMKVQDPSGPLADFANFCRERKDATQAIGFGKHRGKTFEAVRREHPEYAQWALTQQEPSSALAAFVDYCRRHADAPSAPPQQPQGSSYDTPARPSRPQAQGFTCPVHQCPMNGPFTARNGYAHNKGRQFYACAYNGNRGSEARNAEGKPDCGVDGFRWADGTHAFGPEACQRFAEFHGMPSDAGAVAVGVDFGLGPMATIVVDGLVPGPDGRLQLPRAPRPPSSPDHAKRDRSPEPHDGADAVDDRSQHVQHRQEPNSETPSHKAEIPAADHSATPSSQRYPPQASQ